MPDEATPAPDEVQDTPTDAAVEETKPAEDAPASTDNWEQRYNDLRPEFDRKNQLLSAAEGHQGPELQAQALRQIGVEVELEQEEEDKDDEWVDPDDRIDKLEAKLAERDEADKEAQWAQREESFIDTTLSEIEGKESMKLSDAETKFVVTNALSNRDPQSGEPNLQGAFDDLKGIKSAARDEYLASKKSTAAPIGTAGEEKVDFTNADARRKFMSEDLAARMAAEES